MGKGCEGLVQATWSCLPERSEWSEWQSLEDCNIFTPSECKGRLKHIHSICSDDGACSDAEVQRSTIHTYGEARICFIYYIYMYFLSNTLHHAPWHKPTYVSSLLVGQKHVQAQL